MRIFRAPPDTRAIYDRNAEAYDRARSKTLFEARWLTRFSDRLPKGGKVLDLGCGAGQPIAAWLIAEGFRYTGVDFSDAMLALARARWPEEDWRTADMRTLDLGEAFDGLIAWNSFFHLTQAEQRETLPRLAHHLAPHGTLMVTTGPTSGETTGTVANDVVFHASLSPAEYATLLEENGLTLTAFMAEDPHCQDHTVLMAKKTGD